MKSEQYIIAIGASAGGMNEINKFFDFTPLDGVSYIVIQHLSADYKSMMKSLLDKHSKLDIVEAKNNMQVEINKIYLVPSSDVMTIKDGRLMLTLKTKGVNYTINTFFTSLAQERGNRAIGIILSGTGADGTEGMKDIKKNGGFLIASNPENAEFGQMPGNAIATGLVNYVANPEDMPAIIQQYVKGDKKKSIGPNEDDIEDEKMMVAITDLIKTSLPEDFSGYKKSTLLRRIKRRVSLHNLDTLQNYLELLKKDNTELQNLVKDFLISVTSFFRDRAAFEVLKQTVIPELIKSRQNDELKMWVAGCATGEEAYSLAILVHEQLEAAQKNLNVKIFATDIDDEALKIAGKGYFNDSIAKDITPERLEKYFTRDPQKGYKIKPVIREILIFAHHDLVKNPPYCNMDFISCRNMLIYINPLLQKRIVSMLHFGLKYGGYLFLGPSESVIEIGAYLEEIDRKWKIYRNIQSQKSLNFDTFLMPTLLEGKEQLNFKPLIDNSKNSIAKGPEIIDTNLLIDLGYAGALVDKNNQVLNVFGDTPTYLINKMFVHNLDDLLVKPLQVAFTTARMEADKQNKLIAVKGISVEGIETPVTLKVQPLISGRNGVMRLVLFCQEDRQHNEQDTITFDESFYGNKYTVNIEEELLTVKEKLTASNELLNASNENMQSFNEELLSANEEMQSTNEEMQSVNEELQTINAEYQSKIRELSELNDDLNNYFRSNVNGQIFVDKNLLLMKFSPAAATHINVRESDVGRPLSNISTNIQFETIDTDIREVLLNGSVITKEIQAIDGKWYQVMTMPYLREGNHKADGAIITFNDISELKKIQKELSKSNKSLMAINTDLDNFVYTASHDLLSPINNIDQIVYLIRNKITDDETREYTDLLSSSVTKFRGVINEMAAIGNIESEMLKMETIHLDEMIGDIINSMKWKITSENADIKIFLEVKEITFSKKNCRSMIFNLINNALKFRSPERNPEIVIKTSEQPDSILLSVKDNGIGIDKNRIESIFKMYKRLNTNNEGQGLGLFLINKIIDGAGGRVEVVSEPGAGSEFKVFLMK